MTEEIKKFVPPDKKARKYQLVGGMIAYLMKNVKGMREFVHDQLFVKCVASKEFLYNLKKDFPDIDDYPSIYTVNEFKKKINALEKENGYHRTALAMKDEVRNMKAFGELNLVEEEMKLFEKSKDILRKVETVMLNSFSQVKAMSIPPDFFWNAVQNYQKVLELRGSRLSKLDELAIRYGYAPPKQVDKNLILAQQNINQVNISSEVQEIINTLDINKDNLFDDKYFKNKIEQAAEVISSDGEDQQYEEGIVEEKE